MIIPQSGHEYSPARLVRCRHFNGDASNAQCRAGIPYASVQVVDGATYRLPCIFAEGVSHHCPLAEMSEPLRHTNEDARMSSDLILCDCDCDLIWEYCTHCHKCPRHCQCANKKNGLSGETQPSASVRFRLPSPSIFLRSCSKSRRTRFDRPPGCRFPQSARPGGSIIDTCFVVSPAIGPGLILFSSM